MGGLIQWVSDYILGREGGEKRGSEIWGEKEEKSQSKQHFEPEAGARDGIAFGRSLCKLL